MVEESAFGSGSKSAPHNRRRLRFSLRALLLVVALVSAVLAGWQKLIRPYQMQDSVRLRILRVGGTCETRPGPWYARLILGDEHCQVVTGVDLAGRPVVGSTNGFSHAPGLPARCDEYPVLLVDLGQLSEVESIDVRGCDVTDEILATWSRLLRLKHLVLSNTLIQDSSKWPAWRLQELHVDSTPMCDEGLRSIRKYTSLITLDASNTGCDDDTIEAWRCLASLSDLNVANTRISLQSRDAILGLPKLRTLKFLGRSRSLDFCLQMQTVQPLPERLQDFPDEDQAMHWIRENIDITPDKMPLSYLGGVVFSGNWSYPGGLDYEALSELGPLPHVQCLQLDSRYVDDDSLECLEQFPNLRMLSLKDSWTTDSGLQHLVHCPNLEVLDLSNTRITDSGLQYLASCPKLTELILHGTNVTNRGLTSLAQFSELENLQVPPCAFRGQQLVSLLRLPRLSTIVIAGPGTWDRGSRLGEPLSEADIRIISHLEQSGVTLVPYPRVMLAGWDEWMEYLASSPRESRGATLLRWLRVSERDIKLLPWKDAR